MQDISRIYKALLVDDNEIDRLNTRIYLKKYAFIEVAASCSSAEEAISFLAENTVDVFFFDIDMPGLSGHELRKITGNDQACIFITAYPDYAFESFELEALDFLVKPLQKERFAIAMERLYKYLDLKHKAALFEYSLGADTVFIKDGHTQIKVPLHEIIYLEALKDYTRIVTPQKKYAVLSSIGHLLQEAAFKTFIRIHRSYAVQKHFIAKVSSQEIHLNDIILPVGRSYKDSIAFLIK